MPSPPESSSATGAARPAGRENLTRFAWLSIGAAVLTIVLKFAAYLLTGSVGLLSDAAESIVNLVAAFVALIALHVAAQPADEDHQFGHSKAEYFSAAVEGVMIFVAAVFILWSSVQRFFAPEPLENVGVGLGVSVAASVVNGLVALVLMRAGRTHRSITLVADGKHLLTDVWTSAGVVVGVLLVSLTGWLRLDPIIAFLVGCNIIWTGWHLVRESVDGLMDHAPSAECQADINRIIEEVSSPDVHIHGVRARVAGHENHVAMHVLVPGSWTVQRGHDVLEDIEARFRDTFAHITIDTHLEPIEDPRSYE
jgi:cation diffusion facilitator family transporter